MIHSQNILIYFYQNINNLIKKIKGIDTDDLMATGETDSEGRFQIKGFTHEITTIDPKLNIYHGNIFPKK